MGYKNAKLTEALVGDIWACFLQSATFGTGLTVLFFPYLLSLVVTLKNLLPTLPFLSGLNYDAIIFSLLISGIHSFTYEVWGGFFALCDHFQWLQQYKMYRKAIMTPSASLVSTTLIQAATSQLLLMPLTIYFGYPYLQRLGLPDMTDPLPSNGRLFFCFAVSHIWNSIGFYTSHRLLHHKLLYSTFHKQVCTTYPLLALVVRSRPPSLCSTTST